MGIRSDVRRMRTYQLVDNGHDIGDRILPLELRQILIEHILTGMTLPQVIAVEDQYGQIHVRDLGIVRAVHDFINGEFPIHHNFTNPGEDLRYFSDLTFLQQNKIEDHVFSLFVLQAPTSDELMDSLISRYYSLLHSITKGE